MKKPLLYLLSALFSAACAQSPELDNGGGREATLTSDEAKFLAEAQMPVKFDESEINRIVGDVISLMEDTPSTRSGGTRTVSEIRPLSVVLPASSATRSDDETGENTEELFYIVNFADNAGYSVIAADRRIKDEIALFVGQGHLDKDSIDNPGLNIMISRLDAYATHSIAEHKRWQDSVEVVIIEHLTEKYPDLADQIKEWLASLRNSSNSNTRVTPPPYNPSIEEPPFLIATYYRYGPWTNPAQPLVAPMIPVMWGQGGRHTSLNYVFNRSVEASFSQSYIDDLHAYIDENGIPGYIPAGCVPIATVQLMMYWEKSNRKYHERTITADDWDDLRAHPDLISMSFFAPTDIQQLCSDLILWIGQDIGTAYHPHHEGGSSASSQDAINLLSRLGYHTSSRQNYSYNPVETSLLASRPIFMSGRDGTDAGHAWLIDGLLKQSRTLTIEYEFAIPRLRQPGSITMPLTRLESVFEVSAPESRAFFHNNFGWHGTDNGYYIAGMFDANNDPDLPSNTRSGEPLNFEFDLKMWPNIYK